MKYFLRFLVAISIASQTLVGATQVAAQTLSPPVRLSTLSGSSIGARIVQDGAALHVVWVEGFSSTNASIYYRKSADSGATWLDPVLVKSNVPTPNPLVMLAARGGTVVAVWTTNYTTGSASGGLFTARSSDAGASFTVSVDPVVTPAEIDALVRPLPGLSGTQNSYVRPSSLLIDSANRVHIGMYGGPNIGQAIHKMSCDGAASWKAASLISIGDRGIDAEAPRLFEQDGVVFAAYRSSLDGLPIEGWPPFSVRVARMTAPNCTGSTSGMWLSPSQVVSNTGYGNMANTYGISVSNGPSGTHLGYWNEANGGANLTYRTRPNATSYWSADADLTSSLAGFGANHLEHDGDAAEYGEAKINEGSVGRLHMVAVRNDRESDSFGQYTSRLNRLFYRYSANAGAAWTPAIALNGAADGFGVDSAAAGTKVHVVWSSTSFNSAGGAEIIYRSVDVTAAAQLVASVNPMSFAATPVGGSSTITQTLTNISAGTLNGMSVAVSGSGFSVSGAGCAGSVASGASCTVSVTFAPTVSGAQSGNLTLSGGGLSSAFSVPVSGATAFDTVVHYYRNILSRAPDSSGDAFWRSEAQRLQNKGASPIEAYIVMATYFFSSSEYLAFNRTDADFVEDLYRTFFNRASDGGGKSYWLDQISGGLPRGNVLNAFMFSNEFSTFMTANVGSTAMRAEIAAVIDFYRGALARLPEDSGLIYWTNQLRRAQCAPANQKDGLVYSTTLAITSAFYDGSEYAGRSRTNPQFVSDLYNSFFRAGGDLSGVSFWIRSLDNQTKTRSQERIDFVNAPQYAGRVSAIVAEPCTTNLQ